MSNPEELEQTQAKPETNEASETVTEALQKMAAGEAIPLEEKSRADIANERSERRARVLDTLAKNLNERRAVKHKDRADASARRDKRIKSAQEHHDNRVETNRIRKNMDEALEKKLEGR